MKLLHLSDLHLSRFGESGSWTQRNEKDLDRWETVKAWQNWQIEGRLDKKGRPDKLRLVDPEGVVHKMKSWSKKKEKEEKICAALLAQAMKRHQTSAVRLVRGRPEEEDLEAMLGVDPYNTNLRFLKMLDDVHRLAPDLLLITGDITDKGFGYGLVLHYLKPWIDAGRLISVPGNHDSYDMLPRLGRKARTATRAESYRDFACKIGLEPDASGAFLRRVGDIAVVGLNSCLMPKTPLSASGAVSKEQLAWLSALSENPDFTEARLRIGMLHHHLIRMPFDVGKRSPFDVGMRLRNAERVVEACTDAKIDILCNGHRHHGYMVQLPGRPMILSSPSSTLGCKSTGRTYAWGMDLDSKQPFPMINDLDVCLPGTSSDGSLP